MGGIKPLMSLIMYDFILWNTKEPKDTYFDYIFMLHGDDYIPFDDYSNSTSPYNQSKCQNENTILSI